MPLQALIIDIYSLNMKIHVCVVP